MRGALLVGLLLLVGCSAGLDDLDGTTFTSTDVTGRDLVEGSAVVLTFGDDNLSVAAGCNTQAGAYEVDDETLRWTGDVASTLMACSDDLEAQDDWLRELFTDGVTAELDGSTLTLTSDEVEIVLEEG